MHILFILEYFKPHVWWSEILFDNVIQWLLEKWNTVTILTTRYMPELSWDEELLYWIWKKAKIYRVWHNRYDFMWYWFWKALKLIKNNAFDCIQTTTFNAALIAWTIRTFNKIPTVLHVHEVYIQLRYTFFGWKWFFYKLFERFIFQLPFDYYTCSSLYTKNSLRLVFWIPDNKLTTTYCGINYEIRNKNNINPKISKQLRNDFWLNTMYIGLYFWRPWVAKWLLDYIHAIPYILQSIPNFKAFLIVPKNEKSRSGVIQSTIANDEVILLIDSLHITESVVWIDSVPYHELINYIAMSDVVVLPTKAEWFWLAIAEVCALWKALVTTNVGSVPEVVCGESIQLVEPGNAKDIARGVVDIHSERVLTINQKHFYWDQCVNKFLEVYKDICI